MQYDTDSSSAEAGPSRSHDDTKCRPPGRPFVLRLGELFSQRYARAIGLPLRQSQASALGPQVMPRTTLLNLTEGRGHDTLQSSQYVLGKDGRDASWPGANGFRGRRSAARDHRDGAPPFVEWARHEMRRSPATIARYREALNWVIRDVGDLPVARLNVGHILSLRRRMDQRGCGEARIAAILNALRSFLKFCCEVLRLTTLDPRQIRVPRIPRRDVVYLTKEEVNQFVRAIVGPGERWDESPLARLRFRALVEVLLGTGARISEVLSLDRRDVDSESREVKIVGKGRKQRVLFFTDRAMEWLGHYLGCRPDDPLRHPREPASPPELRRREDRLQWVLSAGAPQEEGDRACPSAHGGHDAPVQRLPDRAYQGVAWTRAAGYDVSVLPRARRPGGRGSSSALPTVRMRHA